MIKKNIKHIHLVSDSTGETLQAIIKALLVQFDHSDIEHFNWIFIENNHEMEKVCHGIEKNPGLVFYTFGNKSLKEKLEKYCDQNNIPFIDVLKPTLKFMIRHLGQRISISTGEQHSIDHKYFDRIHAMEFALYHDDGQKIWDVDEADVILIGVSRTSKTPTCMYLANKGIYACNIPFVAEIGIPESVVNLSQLPNPPLIVGLIKDPSSLFYIRQKRLSIISDNVSTSYADLENIKEEVKLCRRLCEKNHWPIIDISDLSIEETSAHIIKLLEKRKHKIENKENIKE